jgi:hypothetical protein
VSDPALTVAGVYLMQLLVGVLAVAWLHPAREGAMPSPAGVVGRALLVGPAVLALQMMLMHVAGVPFSIRWTLGPWLLVALWRHRDLRRAFAGPSGGWAGLGLSLFAMGLFVVTVVAGLREPIYAADVIRNFALMGRVFETHGSLAPEALKALTTGGHIEYPPLMALNESLVFRVAGDERAWLVKPFFALASLAWLLLVTDLFTSAWPPRLAVPGALLAMGVPSVAWGGMSGMADPRLMVSVLLLGMEARALLAGPSTATAARFGAYAVVAALTKNEGVALAAVSVVVLAGLGRGGVVPVRSRAAILVAVLAGGGLWQVFKAVHGIEERYLGPLQEAFSLGDLSRLGVVLGHFHEVHVAPLLTLKSWPLVPAVVVIGWGLATRGVRGRVSLWLAVLAAHVALYALVFAFTPKPLDWHLTTAARRLLTHTTPWVVLMLVDALAVFGSGASPVSSGGALGYAARPAPEADAPAGESAT